MSFYDRYNKIKHHPYEEILAAMTVQDVDRALNQAEPDEYDLLALLSPAAAERLEDMAQKARKLTIQNFGKVISLYAPLYLTDYCVNKCAYCSFSFDNDFPRRKLTALEISQEAKALKDMGIQHVILLTGESRIHSSVAYLTESAHILRKYASSISIEVQPLDTEEYRQLFQAGVDGLTVYQEVYNEEIYKEIHIKGPKRNYRYRLDAPERGCQAGMRSVNIGALLGMDNWRKEVFFTALHAQYLQKRYLETDIAVSFPRIRPNLGGFEPRAVVEDKDLVQAMLAVRLFMPRAGITLSTREEAELRDHLIKLGVTKMSAASSTVVGGYAAKKEDNSQFEISDTRSVAEVKKRLKQLGYQPVFKDWDILADEEEWNDFSASRHHNGDTRAGAGV
ncbi:2-iminoacetate synthase ThiH [Bacillus badius]|uniref:2-iminoacetate synthase (ThiH) n=1 Tax=Bacillus badius TaxID=1455 RepID=A0ABR5AS13_BACBA|nr:2-iminoacetate synthase ThiH [Bacillus badius]KIL72646.1 2-iminoacetate synthase (ThiH) [Bacillus badius]KIL77146.1 2-iminoacetate synthase (ThiH) [Bacillus badius]MED4716729.1 2-iminoacetate synthase ThiH [Bacillus badius]